MADKTRPKLRTPFLKFSMPARTYGMVSSGRLARLAHTSSEHFSGSRFFGSSPWPSRRYAKKKSTRSSRDLRWITHYAEPTTGQRQTNFLGDFPKRCFGDRLARFDVAGHNAQLAILEPYIAAPDKKNLVSP